RLRFSGPKTSIICSPMTSLKTSIKTITYLSDIGCLEILGASLPLLRVPSKNLSYGYIFEAQGIQATNRLAKWVHITSETLPPSRFSRLQA
ncbi:hypothetical protein, partial [Escherichia sp. 20412-1]|uniref:hypothetical protein n=1 Tax=Escherichia sp. 20412-1 TaxID=2137853 RepID=UPI0035C10B76